MYTQDTIHPATHGKEDQISGAQSSRTRFPTLAICKPELRACGMARGWRELVSVGRRALLTNCVMCSGGTCNLLTRDAHDSAAHVSE